MSEHYYTENPVSEIKEIQFHHAIKGVTLSLTSVSGVFSFSDKVDKASLLLIENFQPSGSSILDMGCGYGAIGLFIKAMFQHQHVTLSDINARAIDYTLRNASKNQLDVTVLKSDLFSSLDHRVFDDIVSNPPIAAGKQTNIQLIHEAYHHLSPGGALWIVAFHNKGGSTLKKIMEEKFKNVKDIEKSGGIRVYKSVKT